MYTIVNVFYGVPVPYDLDEAFDHELAEYFGEDSGFKSLYSGSGEVHPVYFGVDMDVFDEAGDEELNAAGTFTDVGKLKLSETPSQIKQYEELLENLPEHVAVLRKQWEDDGSEIPEMMDDLVEIIRKLSPRVYFCYNTS